MQDPSFNRDDSLLEFIRRVLAQAADEATPLLERVRFLAIFSGILDEFFMKRRARLSAQPELLARCRETVMQLLNERTRIWRQELRPALKREGVALLDYSELSEAERRWANQYFEDEVFPLLTPLAVDPAHPFPFLSNLSLSLGVALRRPEGRQTEFARIKIPDSLPQWVRLGDKELRFIRLRDVVAQHVASFFPGSSVEAVAAFRVTRNANVGFSSDDVEDISDVVAEELRMRRVAELVRLQIEKSASPWIIGFLKDELELADDDIYLSDGGLNDSSLIEIAGLKRPDLRFKAQAPRMPFDLGTPSGDLFKLIRARDRMVHFPFESWDASVLRFIEAAVTDRHVQAIKITLYRLGDESPLIPLLIRAAEAGKQVVCVVELKARFDEARNINISETLERSGVHVVYGVVGYKTHAKACLVLRRDGPKLRAYAYLGTGNFNPSTARSYTDFGLFTANTDIGRDLGELFNYLTGLAPVKKYRKLLVSPSNLRQGLLEAVAGEAKAAKAGKPCGMVLKMNTLEDPDLIAGLYKASQAGVPITLLVRGFCCIQPGVAGLSESIVVKSVVGRFLEHSRVYHFKAGAANPVSGTFYIGSADWMSRNLDERVELLVPIEEKKNKERLWNILELYQREDGGAWQLGPDGRYLRLAPEPGAQAKLLEEAI